MKFKCSLLAFVIIGAAGTLLHFTYEWSGENPIVGIFSAVNESVWEHQKLLFFPSLIYFAAEFLLCGKKHRNYPAAAFVGIMTGILTIITVFYTYSGILGYSIPAIDIALFYLGTAVTIIVRNIIIKNGSLSSGAANLAAVSALLVIAVLFGVWTANPPKLSIFIPDLS